MKYITLYVDEGQLKRIIDGKFVNATDEAGRSLYICNHIAITVPLEDIDGWEWDVTGNARLYHIKGEE